LNRKMKAVTEILKKIESAATVLVVSHQKPDGDAIGSSLALALLLREKGKDVVVCNYSGVPAALCFLPESETVVQQLAGDYRADLALVVDCAEFSRIGFDVRPFCAEMISIDHHPRSELFAAHHYLDEKASATGVLIYRLFHSLSPFSTDVCQCLFTAISADTGSFQFSNADVESFAVASSLVRGGADPAGIARNLYADWTVDQLRLLSVTLENMKMFYDERVCLLQVDHPALDKYNSLAEDTEAFVGFARAVKGVLVGVLMLETDAGWRISLRSHAGVDVSVVARRFAGGGHKYAAGATLQGTLAEVECALIAALEPLFMDNHAG